MLERAGVVPRLTALLAGLDPTAGVAAIAIALPYLTVGRWLGLVPLAPALMGVLLLVTVLYGWSSEVAKHGFWRRHGAAAAIAA